MRKMRELRVFAVFTIVIMLTACSAGPDNALNENDLNNVLLNDYFNVNTNIEKKIVLTANNQGNHSGKILTTAQAGIELSGSESLGNMDYMLRTDLGYPRIERILSSYEQTIKKYSVRYGFDWRLVIALMNQESRFRIQAVSHRGAYGLMQIMPGTGRDVSNALGIDGIHNPENNIAGGVYYLWQMQEMFAPPESERENTAALEDDILKLALAAYNGGPSRVRDAQRIAGYLRLDPYKWEVIRDILPLLERRYYTLHQLVWEDGRPSGNYFHGWPETVNYVDRVWEYYSYYQLMFN